MSEIKGFGITAEVLENGRESEIRTLMAPEPSIIFLVLLLARHLYTIDIGNI